jgi:hypothetical protein
MYNYRLTTSTTLAPLVQDATPVALRNGSYKPNATTRAKRKMTVRDSGRAEDAVEPKLDALGDPD